MPDIHPGVAALLVISQSVYIPVVLTLGARLLRLAIRTRKLPESLLAAHFLLCLGLGYLLLSIGMVTTRLPGLLPVAADSLLIGAGQLLSCVGVFCGICFNFLVFRKNETWARAGVALAATTLAVGYVGYGLTGGFAHGRSEGVWFWLFYGTYLVGAAWVMFEPLRYYGVMRKRVQLGLAEPLVVNRFLMWGAGSVGRFLMVAVGAVATVLITDQNAQLASLGMSFTFIGVALVGLGVAGCYWLTFFPTRGFVRLIEGRAPANG